MRKQQILKWRLPTVTHKAQCDEVRLYFRGYGASDYQPQPMFSPPNPQQSRHISLSHGPYDLISKPLKSQYWRFLSLIQQCPFYLQKYKERKTLNLRQRRTRIWPQKKIYWSLCTGTFMAEPFFI